ncbi:sensor domain-containing protein [Paenibacillus flagellatus]|nr:sensor domain-containing protein [Paenibacillus flagellatus]
MKTMRRYGRQTLYMLFITLPFSIIAFVVSTTFAVVGLALTPLWIGLPILQGALIAARRLMAFDLDLQRRLTAVDPDGAESPIPAYEPIRYRDLFTQGRLYAPLLYWLLKLPIAVLQFAAAVVLPVAGVAVMLSPLVYIVLARYGIDIFADDVVMDILLPALSPYQRSWVASGIGLVLASAGIVVLNNAAKGSVRWLSGLTVPAERPIVWTHATEG